MRFTSLAIYFKHVELQTVLMESLKRQNLVFDLNGMFISLHSQFYMGWDFKNLLGTYHQLSYSTEFMHLDQPIYGYRTCSDLTRILATQNYQQLCCFQSITDDKVEDIQITNAHKLCRNVQRI